LAIVVILLLGLLWAAVLLPPILRARRSGGRNGVSDFMDSLKSLGRGSTERRRGGISTMYRPHRPAIRPIAPPMAPLHIPGSRTPVQRRRRDVLVALTIMVALAFVVALMAGSTVFWVLCLAAVGALAGYCYLLVQIKHRGRDRRVKVRPIGQSHPSYTPDRVGDNVIVLRRTVGY
jgi:hypothetical protein